jgi:hypothetical protein
MRKESDSNSALGRTSYCAEIQERQMTSAIRAKAEVEAALVFGSECVGRGSLVSMVWPSVRCLAGRASFVPPQYSDA